jgi:hypothetical protein
VGSEQVAEPFIKTASRSRTAARWRVARAGSHDGPPIRFYHLGAALSLYREAMAAASPVLNAAAY